MIDALRLKNDYKLVLNYVILQISNALTTIFCIFSTYFWSYFFVGPTTHLFKSKQEWVSTKIFFHIFLSYILTHHFLWWKFKKYNQSSKTVLFSRKLLNISYSFYVTFAKNFYLLKRIKETMRHTSNLASKCIIYAK